LLYSRTFIIKLSVFSVSLIAPLLVINILWWTINTDLIVYGVGLNAFSQQFWSGELYPRWLMNTNAGLGSPMFIFYGPLAFYAGSLLEPFAIIDPNGYGRVIASFIPALFVAGITSYRWLSRYFPRKEAEQGALIYATFPYTILYIYASFGLAHIWALALLPFALEAAHDMTQAGWRAMPKLAVSYALLALTHLPTTLVFAAIPCLYVFHFSKKSKFTYFTYALLAGLLGAGLAAIYLLPAVANKAFVTSEHFLDGQLVYYQNFYNTRFGFGVFLIILPMLGFFVELPRRMKWRQASGTKFWLIICGGLFFMTTEFSMPIWHILPPLQYLQFPFRFFSAMLPAVLFIVVSWLPYVKSKGFYGYASVIACCSLIYFSSYHYFLASDKYSRNITQHNIIIAPEYRTPWSEAAKLDNPRELPQSYISLPAATLEEGRGDVALVSQTARTIVLKTTIRSDTARIAIKRFYFPGWIADNPAITIGESNALLAIDVPKGEHTVTLRLPWLKGEREGAALSLMTLIGLAIALFWAKRLSRPPR
jgi:hypothetical protein